MKNILYTAVSVLMLLFQYNTAYSEILKPVKWTFETKKISSSEYQLLFKARIDEHWHLYDQAKDSDFGPIPLSFSFDSSAYMNTQFQCVNTVISPTDQVLEKYDKNFEMDISYYEHQATFIQHIKLLKTQANDTIRITGYLTFQTCTDEKCLPPTDIDFNFTIIAEENLNETPVVKTDVPTSYNTQNSDNDTSLIAIFIGGFLGGFLALLTPCVFPMIPMTVSYFIKNKGGIFLSVIYALSIISIYVSLGMLITLFAGPDALNALASNIWMNLLFFVVFVLFGISFLGAFEIRMPSSLINRSDKLSNKGGILGVLFMAFTLSLVSFSCTGPIIGSLLVEASVGGNYFGPMCGMLGFSSALALPFFVFSIFPNSLNAMPQSGGWLNSVKVVLGLLEIALSLKFLSVVDLAYHWNILTREVFVAIWVVLSLIIGFYLLGKIQFKYDSPLERVGITRLFLSIFAFAFAVYLFPGMFGAPLKYLSGLAPPRNYSEDNFNFVRGNTIRSGGHETGITGMYKAYTHIGPHDIVLFQDYDKGLEYAKMVNKPILIDFTGYSCVNCRKMEDNIWGETPVVNYLREDYVVISLYVDDKKELPKEEQYTSSITGKNIRTYGNKWSDFQTKVYKVNSQPYYVLIDHKEKLLIEPKAYTPNVMQYAQFLEKGLKKFRKK